MEQTKLKVSVFLDVMLGFALPALVWLVANPSEFESEAQFIAFGALFLLALFVGMIGDFERWKDSSLRQVKKYTCAFKYVSIAGCLLYSGYFYFTLEEMASLAQLAF